MVAGIYAIEHSASGKRYIGSAVSFERRWRKHRAQLRGGGHHSVALQRAWDKYGEAAFVFKKLLVCAGRHLLLYEQRALDVMRPAYNSAKVAGSSLGLIRSLATRAKISANHRGHPMGEETKAKIAAYRTGRKHSLETRLKMSQSQRAS